MTVSQPDVIDFVAFSRSREQVRLVMVEERPWGDSGMLLPELQEKFNTYLAYVTEGRLSADFPEYVGKAIRIDLRSAEPPGDRELEFLRIVTERFLRPRSIRCSWSTLDDDEEIDI